MGNPERIDPRRAMWIGAICGVLAVVMQYPFGVNLVRDIGRVFGGLVGGAALFWWITKLINNRA